MPQTRAKRPEVKIPVKDYAALEAYCKAKNYTSVTSLVLEWVSDFLSGEDVQQVIKESSVSAKKKQQIERKEEQLRKLQEELARLKEETGL